MERKNKIMATMAVLFMILSMFAVAREADSGSGSGGSSSGGSSSGGGSSFDDSSDDSSVSSRSSENELRGRDAEGETEVRGRDSENELRGRDAEGETEVRGRDAEGEIRGRDSENELRGRDAEGEVELHQRRERTRTQMRDRERSSELEFENELRGLSKVEQEVHRSQNHVRVAVQSLLVMEDNIQSIGPRVSQIARGIDDSTQKTIGFETEIRNRGAVRRILAGGDDVAAKSLDGSIKENMLRINELRELENQCIECDSELKNMIELQVKNIELEQNRLESLATKERESKGIFGWLWK